MDPNTENPNTDPNVTPSATDAAAAGAAGADAGASGTQDGAPAGNGDPAAAGEGQGTPELSEQEQISAIIDQVQSTDPDALAASAAAATAAAEKPVEGEGTPEEIAAAAAAKAAADAAANAEPETDEAKLDKEASAEAEKLGIKNEAANAKFKELYGIAKRMPELEQRAARGDELVNHIQSTGATGEQLGIALNYIRAANTGDVPALESAYSWLQQELTWLATKLGRPAPGVDVLAEHADLQDEVKNGMARERAEELAVLRNTTKVHQQHNQRQQQQHEHVTQAEQAIADGRESLNRLGSRLATEDGEKAIARMDAVMAKERDRILKLPPAIWATEFELAYLRAKAAEPAQAPASKAPPRVAHQPLRPTGGAGAGGTVKTPTNEREALELGLQLANSGGYGSDY